jgi:serine/threonine protein kinase
MDFKIPNVPNITGRFRIHRRGLEKKYQGCPVTKQNEIDIVKTIGRGSFGIVKLCKKENSKVLILKEMIDHNEDQEKLFLKEAKMMNEIQHQNIVRSDSILEPVHQDSFAFLMEYVYFDFIHFGLKTTKFHLLKIF